MTLTSCHSKVETNFFTQTNKYKKGFSNETDTWFLVKYLRSLIFITLITDLGSGSVANLPNNQQSGIPATKLHAFDISCQLINFTIDITEISEKWYWNKQNNYAIISQRLLFWEWIRFIYFLFRKSMRFCDNWQRRALSLVIVIEFLKFGKKEFILGQLRDMRTFCLPDVAIVEKF